jgi:uncharacterized membrane protein
MNLKLKTKKDIIRVGGKLKEIVTMHDEKGNIVHKIISPLMVEFYPRDLIQVIIGASLLAIPVGFTQEVWDLGTTLPWNNVLGIGFISLSFIAIFVYYNFYRENMKDHWDEYLKRLVVTYFLSLAVVAVLLTLIQMAPWQTDWALAMKRVILVTFPASMSAAIADMIK